MFQYLKKTIENTDTKSGKYFDMFIQVLIVLSLISFSIETIPNLNLAAIQYLKISEIIIVAVFSAEYILRVLVADRKLKFILSFNGLIDLLAVLPFYVASGIDLRSIRVFRLFRLLRAFKILRYSNAIARLKNAFYVVKDEFVVFIVATFFLLYISAVGIYYFENAAQPEQFKSVFHCLWWSVATLTTVGYGDVYPITVGGKIFASIVIIIGLGIVAVPTGLLASALTKTIKDN